MMLRRLLLLCLSTMLIEVNAKNTTDCWDVCSYYYLGTVDVTASGIRCQSWSAQSPHKHIHRTDDWFPFGLNASENYCRDISARWKPWCFTEDPDVRWEQCDIPLCNSSITSGNITCGDISCKIDRTHCPDWGNRLWTTTVAGAVTGSHIPSFDESTSTENSTLSTVDDNMTTDNSTLPTASIKTTVEDNTTNNYADNDCWDVCGHYTGTVNHTSSGLPCQRWQDQTPHAHYFTDDYGVFPDIGGLNEADNYCRDPETGQWKPWCFTTNPGVRWEICDIPLCNSDTTSKDIQCGDQVCDIDRSHCNISSIGISLGPLAYLIVIVSSVKIYMFE